ncbi:CynX/NimT family MFS transporter [Peterkaempfera griseoplana]|uniref:CynX/NimT family MFS transporter n=1 Tax=Peterkaempfera griseoplana TaxID=66896 RepID=UPI000A66F84C|nr:MFS transporter [Peterkaempfera griseoplana]
MSTAADPTARPAPDRAARTGRDPARTARRIRLLLAAAIVAAAFNLRPAVTSLGPLLERVRDGLGMSATVAGLLTAVPSLCFALFGLAAPALARRIGPAAVVTAGMGAVTAGLAARALAGSTAVFLLLSAVALAGIAVSNVLMPVIVKRYFPDRVGPLIGLYSMALSAGTAVAAAVAVPLTAAVGGSWRAGLGVWAGAAAVGLALWLAVLAAGRDRGAGPRPAPSPGTAAGEPGGERTLRILRSPTAWALAVFFGLQSTGAYATMGWLPQIYQDAGISAGESGVLLAVTMAISVPVSFVLPSLAAARGDQRLFVVLLGGCGLAGYLGLAFAPAGAPWLWAALAGLSNCCFPLAITMIGLRARSAAGVAKLSAFAQSLGYLISIPGPVLVGALYQGTGSWYAPVGLLAALLVPQIGVGLLAGRARQIEDEV